VEQSLTTVAGFAVDLARAYDPETHLWVQDVGEGRFRLGLDALGVETSGTLAAVAFVAPGTEVVRGEPFGSMEAAKFVGPLILPLTGNVVAVNEAVQADPSVVERDPYGAGWLVEVAAVAPAEFLPFVRGDEAVASWFAAAVQDYRLKGVLAE